MAQKFLKIPRGMTDYSLGIYPLEKVINKAKSLWDKPLISIHGISGSTGNFVGSGLMNPLQIG